MVNTLVRKAIESMYIGTCDVVEHVKSKNPTTKRTEFTDTPVLLAQPCRVSFSSITPASKGTESAIQQVIKLFIAPELEIKEGSRIDVTQNGRLESYVRSGIPAVYETHQEIVLEKFESWA